MWRRFRPDRDEFQSAVNLLCSKIQTIALRSGMSHVDCDDIERSLAVMENTVRDRITLMLNGLAIQTEYTDHTMCFAAHYLLKAGTEYLAGEPAPGAARTT